MDRSALLQWSPWQVFTVGSFLYTVRGSIGSFLSSTIKDWLLLSTPVSSGGRRLPALPPPPLPGTLIGQPIIIIPVLSFLSSPDSHENRIKTTSTPDEENN